jgi:hypothetical protein
LHCVPPVPQAVFEDPGSQELPAQQPVQFDALQEGFASQLPELPQTCEEALQSTQAPPPVPQLLSLVPARHWFPLQQPLQPVQLGAAVQTEVAASQVLPLALQSVQTMPPLPQATSVIPERHCVPLQQPEQLLQAGLLSQEKLVLLQLFPAVLQSWHCPPPAPQAVSRLPG